jgi:large subunit ribosomal protein L24
MGQTKKRHDAGTFKSHVRKGDEVLVIAGRSLGTRGRVVSVDPQRERAVVEGVNLVTKHQRAQGQGRTPEASARQQGGRIQRPAPIHLSNLMVIDPSNNQPTRVAHKVVDGKSVRVSKSTGAELGRSED